MKVKMYHSRVPSADSDDNDISFDFYSLNINDFLPFQLFAHNYYPTSFQPPHILSME